MSSRDQNVRSRVLRPSRRQFLRGAGGLAIGIPILESLLPRGVHARSLLSGPPRLMIMSQMFGAYGDFMFGDAPAPPMTTELQPGHSFRHGPLPLAVSDGARVINDSYVLRADSAVFTEALASKLNVVRGLDGMSLGGHNKSMFGNMRQRDYPKEEWIPSVDQLVAWSPSYYQDVTIERDVRIGRTYASHYYSNPSTQSGMIDVLRAEDDPRVLWDRLFGSFTAPDPSSGEAPPPLVDQLLPHYQSLRDSNRRLSADDRQRLSAHMQMLAELQSKIQAAGDLAECEVPERSDAAYDERRRNASQSVQLYQLYNRIIAAAIICGITRVATVCADPRWDPFSDFSGDWHEASHQREHRKYADAYRKFFSEVFVDLAARLDVEEGAGQTFLDNSLLMWNNEAGRKTHDQFDKFSCVFGGAGGHFRTGQFIDFRNTNPSSSPSGNAFLPPNWRMGVTENQWWANILYAMGIPRSEWEHYGRGDSGYGPLVAHTAGLRENWTPYYVPAVLDRAGDPLPVLTQA